MAVEYIVSDVLGSGQFDRQPWTDTTGPYRPAAVQYCTDHVSAIDLEVAPIALTKAIDPDLVGLGNDNRCAVIPGATLQDTLTPGTANTVNNWLANHGIPAEDLPLVAAGMTKQQALEAIGSYINPGFGTFSVGGQ